MTIPKLGPRDVFRVWKISKRRDEDISSVCAAFNLTRGEDDTIASARIAFGGMAGTPKRARAAEAALVGRTWSRATFVAAAAALERDFTPLDDWRASAAYRMRVAETCRALLARYEWRGVASPRSRAAGGAWLSARPIASQAASAQRKRTIRLVATSPARRATSTICPSRRDFCTPRSACRNAPMRA